MQKQTMAERGPILPVGDKTQEMVVRPWRMKEEREIGALRKRMTDKKSGYPDFVAAVIGAMFTRLAGHDLEAMKPDARLAAVSLLPMADVLYAFVFLRREAIGPAVHVTVACPACGTRTKVEATLDDLDVRCCPRDHTWVHTFEAPFMIRGELAHTFTLGIPMWNTMRGAIDDRSTATAELIRSCTRRIDQRPELALTVSDLDEMPKREIDRLAKALDDELPGPDVAIEATCTRCSEEIRTSIDWSFDSFFKTPSSS